MFRKSLAVSTAALVLAIPALAAVDEIARIDVSADLSTVRNEKAAVYWGTLEADLEAAIAARVADRIAAEDSEEGAEILVDIREVELANAFERGLNLGDSVLVGQINIKDDTDNSNYDAYELSVSLETAHVVLGEGQTLILGAETTPETYRKLVDTFAEAVVTRLK